MKRGIRRFLGLKFSRRKSGQFRAVGVSVSHRPTLTFTSRLRCTSKRIMIHARGIRLVGLLILDSTFQCLVRRQARLPADAN